MTDHAPTQKHELPAPAGVLCFLCGKRDAIRGEFNPVGITVAICDRCEAALNETANWVITRPGVRI
jgi:hypothetical protein